jgi:hypothetical protein
VGRPAGRPTPVCTAPGVACSAARALAARVPGVRDRAPRARVAALRWWGTPTSPGTKVPLPRRRRSSHSPSGPAAAGHRGHSPRCRRCGSRDRQHRCHPSSESDQRGASPGGRRGGGDAAPPSRPGPAEAIRGVPLRHGSRPPTGGRPSPRARGCRSRPSGSLRALNAHLGHAAWRIRSPRRDRRGRSMTERESPCTTGRVARSWGTIRLRAG